MTSIVLVQPRRSGEQTFPFDIAVVSAVLKEKGLGVLGVDLGTVRADERGPVRAAIAKADLVYFSSWTLGLPGQPRDWRLLVRQAQAYRPLTDAVFVAGGIFPTLAPEVCAASDALDYVLCGDAEAILPELIDWLAAPPDGSAPRGVLIANESSRGVHKGSVEAAYVADLDALPPADRDIVDSRRYHAPLLTAGPSYTVITQRGCRFACAFCHVPAVSPGGSRYRSIDNVMAELRDLQSRCGMRDFVIEDPLFTEDRSWVLAFCEALRCARLDVTWQCLNGLRLDTLDEAILRAMAESGCRHVALGVETLDVKQAETLGRTADPDRLQEILKTCRECGVEVTAYFVLNLPGKGLGAQFREVLAARRMPILLAHFSPLRDFPGMAYGSREAAYPPGKSLFYWWWQRFLYLVFYLNLSRLKRLRQLGALRRNKLGKIGQKIRRG
jgi:radical SAM superfamily enzyme YgiQ (UPF0313 family)